MILWYLTGCISTKNCITTAVNFKIMLNTKASFRMGSFMGWECDTPMENTLSEGLTEEPYPSLSLLSSDQQAVKTL
jgi:hypothetical protein